VPQQKVFFSTRRNPGLLGKYINCHTQGKNAERGVVEGAADTMNVADNAAVS